MSFISPECHCINILSNLRLNFTPSADSGEVIEELNVTAKARMLWTKLIGTFNYSEAKEVTGRLVSRNGGFRGGA